MTKSKKHPEAEEPIILEPCQFCASIKIEFLRCPKVPTTSGGALDVWIYCRECSASGPHAPTAEIAAQYWNLGKPEGKEEARP